MAKIHALHAAAFIVAAFISLSVLPMAGCGQNNDNKGKKMELGDGLFAKISTDKGDIVVKLDYKKAPLTVCNFAALAEGKMSSAGGKPFYNGLNFHRVISKANGDSEDFMIQGGDPLGNGSGGPGYNFPDEFDPTLLFDKPGVLAMANAGPDTNGSQFFITLVPCPWLNGKHTIFGQVVEGQNVVNTIRQGDKIKSIKIIRNGSEASAFKASQASFDALLQKVREKAIADAKQKRAADLALIQSKYPKAQKDAAGVWYIIEKPGKGPAPKPGETVMMRYRGMFLDGKVFDASDFHGGQPLSFNAGAGQLIKGWDESALQMKLGEKRLVILPPELAYGEQGAGGVIPPNSFLVFEMEMVGIK
jgi:peptidylprolyl isomerase